MKDGCAEEEEEEEVEVRITMTRLNMSQNCQVGSRMLKMKLRSAQYGYWCRSEDHWISIGPLIQWLSSIVQAV